jgi:AcrR family transcriptional regulator
MSDTIQREEITRAAWDLFAALGYDGTTMEMIADAAGVPAARVREEFGGKLEIFQLILERAHAADAQVLRELGKGYTGGPEGLHSFVDRYLDHCCDSPKITALWMQRKMLDAVDLRDVDRKFSYPPVARIVSGVGDIYKPGLDPELVAWMLIWYIQTFAYSGIPVPDGQRLGCDDREELARFRRQLHLVIDALLADV